MYVLKYSISNEQRYISQTTKMFLNLLWKRKTIWNYYYRNKKKLFNCILLKEKNDLKIESTLIVSVLDFSQSSSIKRHIQYVTNLKNLEDLNFVISYFVIKIWNKHSNTV